MMQNFAAGRWQHEGHEEVSEVNLIFEDVVENNKSNSAVPLQRQLERLLCDPRVALPLDLLNGLFTIILSVIYVIMTYEPKSFLEAYWYNLFSIIVHIYCFFEFIVRLYASKDRYRFLLIYYSFLEVLTTLPYIIVAFRFGIFTNDFCNFWILLTR